MTELSRKEVELKIRANLPQDAELVAMRYQDGKLVVLAKWERFGAREYVTWEINREEFYPFSGHYFPEACFSGGGERLW